MWSNSAEIHSTTFCVTGCGSEDCIGDENAEYELGFVDTVSHVTEYSVGSVGCSGSFLRIIGRGRLDHRQVLDWMLYIQTKNQSCLKNVESRT